MTEQPPIPLRAIQTVEVHGEALRMEPVMSAQLTMTVEWGYGPDTLNFKFAVSCTLLNMELAPGILAGDVPENNLAAIRGCVIVQYTKPSQSEEFLPEERLREIAATRALGDVVPYIRELIASTAARLGFMNITIDSLPADAFLIPPTVAGSGTEHFKAASQPL